MKQNCDGLTQGRLKSLLDYDPTTGRFTRKVSAGGRAKGSEAGYVAKDGRVSVYVDGKNYRAHRLAFLWMTGEWPTADVDHINGNPSDNQWDNLREATQSENKWNQRLRSANTSGFKGVCWDRRKQKWMAKIGKHGRNQFVGYFDDPRVAARAYDKAASSLHGEFAKTNAMMGLL